MRDVLTFEEQIARSVRESLESGELQSAKGWGRPLEFGDGYDQTPEEFRMGFKILKDAGFVPPEVEMLGQLNAARERFSKLPPDSPEAFALQKEISDLSLRVTIRFEHMREHGL